MMAAGLMVLALAFGIVLATLGIAYFSYEAMKHDFYPQEETTQ
jgi:hypothetical protein